jgi:hypothetical protein
MGFGAQVGTDGGLAAMREHADAEEDCPAGLTPPVPAAAPWRVAHVEVLPGFRLHVRFNDGMEGNVELSDFVHSGSAGVFAALRDVTLFAQARIECGVVTWPGDLDLAPDAMHAPSRRAGRGSWNKTAVRKIRPA